MSAHLTVAEKEGEAVCNGSPAGDISVSDIVQLFLLFSDFVSCFSGQISGAQLGCQLVCVRREIRKSQLRDPLPNFPCSSTPWQVGKFGNGIASCQVRIKWIQVRWVTGKFIQMEIRGNKIRNCGSNQKLFSTMMGRTCLLFTHRSAPIRCG